MPRYEQLKLAQTKKRDGFTYTKVDNIGAGEKKSVIMKPLIIAGVVIVVSALIFGVLKTYSETFSIAIKDFFRKDKPEAISLIADPNIISNENNSFLNNFEAFRFLIQPENNTNKLEVIVSDNTNRFETSVRENIINDNPFTNVMPERITRTSLIPFYNNPDIVRDDIIKSELAKIENAKTNSLQIPTTQEVNTHTNIFSTIDIAKSFNNLDIMKKDTINFSSVDFENLNNLSIDNIKENNSVSSNVVVKNNNENTPVKTIPTMQKQIAKTQTPANIKPTQVKTVTPPKILFSEEKPNTKKEEIINATEFSEILKPKDKGSSITKTMKPATSTYSYTPRTETATKNNDEKINTEPQKEKSAIKREEVKKNETPPVKKENTILVNPKKEYAPQNTYSPQAAVKKYYEEKKETVITQPKQQVEVIRKTPLKNGTVTEKMEREINNTLLPKNINETKLSVENIIRENIKQNNEIKNIETNNSVISENTVTRYINTNRTLNNENNNFNKVENSREIANSITRPVEEKGILYPSATQTPSSIVRDFNTSESLYTPNTSINISRPNQNNIKRGIFLVEYNEEAGTITLLFKERTFENKNPTLEEVILTLLNGATDKENRDNIISCISKETKLLDIFRDDNVLYLNFNDSFEYNPLGSEGMMVQLYQIIYTATQFEGIDSVVFLVNGKFNETIGSEGYIVNKPFSRLERNEVIKSAE